MRIFFTAAIIYLNLCLTSLVFGQSPCDDVQVTLSSQADVNDFPSRYCSTLCSLTISGSDITNLDSLYVLERVGRLVVQYNPELINIDGLSNITTLKSSCGSAGLFIQGNNLLGNLNGLSSLTSISGELAILSNTMLNDLDGLASLDSIGVNSTYVNSIEIGSNASLDNIDALQRITSLPGGVSIGNNPALSNLNGLRSLTTIGPNPDMWSVLYIKSNDGLVNLDGLTALTSIVGGYLDIEDNSALTNIRGLSNLEHIDQWTTSSVSMIISSNASLINLDGLEKIDTITGTFFIENNESLVDIDGLSSLKVVGGGGLNNGFDINNNNSLRNISGLSVLTKIGGGRGAYFHIEGNPVLEGIDLNSLTAVFGGLAGSIGIVNNAMLKNLDGLGSLERVSGGISGRVLINGNASLENIDGLSNFKWLYTARERALEITNNTNLGRFCGLFTLFNNQGIGCGSSACYNPNATAIEGNERNPTYQEILVEGPCDSMSSQPTNLAFSQVTSEGLRVTFNRAPTFTSGYLVLMKSYGPSAPDDVPADGTTYHVGNVVGSSSIVVHAGTDTTFTVSGLEPSTPYYFDVFSWKVGENGNDYLTVNPLEGSQATAGASTNASTVTFADVTSESMTVMLDSAEQGSYITLMKAFGYPSPNDVPVNGHNYTVGNTVGSSTIVVNKGDGSAFTVTGLMPNTPYYFDVYKYNPTTFVYEPSPRQGFQSTTAEEGAGARIAAEELRPYPNPVESSTAIPFRVVKGESVVHVIIYDLAGREVGVLTSGSFQEGLHEAKWDGSDNEGRRVQPGVYVYSVKSEERVVTGRLAVK